MSNKVGLEQAVSEQASSGDEGKFSVIGSKILGKIIKNKKLGLKTGINFHLEKEEGKDQAKKGGAKQENKG